MGIRFIELSLILLITKNEVQFAKKTLVTIRQGQ